MPTFSLVIPTLGRTLELQTMLASLKQQYPADIELIVADQNDDDRVIPLLASLDRRIKVLHLRLTRKSLSNARNEGLARASGVFVAFPDDDCWYPEGLLPKIEAWFGANPAYGVLAIGADDEEGLASGNRWFQNQCDIRPVNSLRTTFANALFLRRNAIPRYIRFDESMASSEETDFILRLLKLGVRGRFDRCMHVGHPRRDMLSGTVSHSRAVKYGFGMGQLVKRHSLFLLWLGLVGYELVRAAAVACRGDREGASFCIAHARGLLSGFVYRDANVV
jgi:glycosyltransferase involved in cell wall biosynthesis